MGQTTTKEEEMFVRGDFAKVLESALGRGATNIDATMPAKGHFSAVEWEALCAICEDGDKTAVLRSSAAKLEAVTSAAVEVLADPRTDITRVEVNEVGALCPVICCFVQLVLVDAGLALKAPFVSQWESLAALLAPAEAATSAQTSRWAAWQLTLMTKFIRLSTLQLAEEVDPGRAARREMANLNEWTSPVIKLIMRYTAASLAKATAEEYSTRENSAHLTQEWLLAAIDHLQAAAQVFQTDVKVGFLERMMSQLKGAVFDAELVALTSHLPPVAPLRQERDSEPWSWSTLSSRFIGQPHALEYLERHFKARSLNLTARNKPSVVVFFGPSGHGKTELAKIIARVEHAAQLREAGAANLEASGHLVVLHMTSYCTRDSIYSLVDPPAAHVGEGILISAIRKVPDAVVVLDEFEKSSADAVQNVWLSAFPRDGKLYSLKDSTRSVSTAKTTFILTCNTCDKLIADARDQYINATPKQQKELRRRWVEQCRAELVAKFGTPFVERIDELIPFAPYSDEEMRAFVLMQLNAKKRDQQRENRDILWTDSFLAFVTHQCAAKGFHAPRVEQILQPHLLKLCEHTATHEASSHPSERFVLLHAFPKLRGVPEVVAFVGVKQVMALGLPGATALVRSFGSEVPTEPETGASDKAPLSKPIPAAEPATVKSLHVMSASSAAATGVAGVTEDAVGPRSPVMEKHLSLETSREKELELELQLEREKVVQLEKEVLTLKQTIVQLQTALGLALAVILSMLLFMSLFVSLTTLISWAAIGVAALQYFVGNAGFLLSVACRGLLSVLGPAKAVAVCALLLSWLIYHGGPEMRCPRCPQL